MSPDFGVTWGAESFNTSRPLSTLLRKTKKFLFTAALFVVLLPLPESPVWLKAKGLDNTSAVKWLHLSQHAIAGIQEDKQE